MGHGDGLTSVALPQPRGRCPHGHLFKGTTLMISHINKSYLPAFMLKLFKNSQSPEYTNPYIECVCYAAFKLRPPSLSLTVYPYEHERQYLRITPSP